MLLLHIEILLSLPLGKESACNAGDMETWVLALGWENPLEKKMATHCSILAWIIPWTEELVRLYSPWGHEESVTEHTTLSYSTETSTKT